MSNKKRKKPKKSKTLLRIATLILVLGFVGTSMAIALSSVFSQNDYSASNADNSAENPTLEEQIQLQIGGYEKVLAREPKNFTALNGLAEIYLQTGQPKKAIPTLEKLVEYYPEQQEYANILELIKQQQGSKSDVSEE